ncbi:ABC transporter atnG [Colletotrichum sp. SAR11_240]|nr:ABC transporter atnG [Colletotrichum sp. SAR11_240]
MKPDDQQRKNSLLRACIKMFTFAQPYLINTTVSFVGQEKPDANFGKGLIGAWALVYLGIAVSNSIFQYHNLRFTTRLRGGLVALIYQQAINIREADTGDITAVALMGTDVERIHMSMSVFHLLWSSLLDIIIASWLLGLQLSLACLAPIILVLVFIAAMSKVSVATNTAQKHWIEKIQERLRVTTTMLSEMKAVKMLGLTQVISNTVQNHRTDEIETSKSFRKLLVATLLLSLSPINLAPIVTFGIYVIISVYWKNDTLLPAQAFTSIALISLLTTPVVAFIQILPMVNILGVSAYEEKWYDTVALACGLDPDFQALKMGDFTLVGSQGGNLSGGQKQRIALARAVYARKRIVILDDIFSGMDARTAHHVSTCLIGRDGLLRRQRASVIIATHSHRIMSLVDSIISLDGGRVQEVGSPMDLVQAQGYVSKLGLMLSPDEDVANDSASSVDPEVSDKHQGETSEMENPREQKHTDVRRKNGEKAVYLYYLKSAGWKAIVMYTAAVTSWSFFSEFSNNGEILNRFSEDMQLLDMDLPSNLLNFTSTGVTILAKVIILVVFSQYLGATLPFLCAILYFLQRFYLQTSRQVRLLGIEAKAPLYTHFSESVAGVATIRAFRWQEQYQERNYEHVDESQRPSYTQGCIQAWLTFVLNLIVAVLAVILVVIVVTWHHKFSAGSVGVSLVMIIGFSEVLARLIQSWTKLESSIGAVARVRRFVSDTETESAAGRWTPPVNWPQTGAVTFSDVVASYGSDASPVLKKLSLAIGGGQHVAICGRSGSGKTSLIMTLLQMTDIKEGGIDIDGVNVSTLLQSELRASINVIPQDPFLMPGTIRFNLNPYENSLDDDRLVEVLGRVGVWSLVQDQGGLDAEMNVNAWSAGQKQLLCLARAMLRQSKVLILDEAMSSVDSETEAIMQDIVDSDFRDCTVLAVMHRLKHVTHYDKVALLGDGKLLEFDTPESLISGETQFAEMFKMKAN